MMNDAIVCGCTDQGPENRTKTVAEQSFPLLSGSIAVRRGHRSSSLAELRSVGAWRMGKEGWGWPLDCYAAKRPHTMPRTRAPVVGHHQQFHLYIVRYLPRSYESHWYKT